MEVANQLAATQDTPTLLRIGNGNGKPIRTRHAKEKGPESIKLSSP